MAHAQYVRSCGKASPLSSQGAGLAVDSAGKPYTGTGLLQLIPSLCVSERYDSNVFYVAPTPGLKREDFVTDVNPMLRANHNGEYAVGYLDVGGFSETYARNSNLNFFGTADTLYLNLDNSIKRLLPNASLIITDYVRYTPTAPGFSTPVAGTSPSNPINIQNVYAQGFLTQRTNNLSNSASALTSYRITPLTSLNASYSYMILRFGSSPVSTGVQLFDSTTQIGTIGAATKLSALDTITVNYSHSHADFSPSTQSASVPSSSFETHMATLGWTRTITPYLTATVGGGGIVIDPGITTYSLNASMTLNTDNNIATVSYGRSAYPSFSGTGVLLITDTVSLSAIQKLALHWELDETASYAHGSSAGGGSSYTSYYGAVDLYYWITRIWSTALSFDYMNYNQENGVVRSNYDRYAITFSVKATWN